MNTTTETIQRETSLKWVAGGSMMEGIAALATMALAIVGLAGVLSQTLAAIGTILIGAAILFEGGSFGAASLAAETRGFEGGGLSAQFLGGVTGIVLGILAILGVVPQTLLGVAVLVFGATFLVSSFSFTQTGWLGSYQGSVQEARSFGNGGQMLVGLAAIVLGILAVIGTDAWTLILAALLALGAAALFSGSALGARSIATVSR